MMGKELATWPRSAEVDDGMCELPTAEVADIAWQAGRDENRGRRYEWIPGSPPCPFRSRFRRAVQATDMRGQLWVLQDRGFRVKSDNKLYTVFSAGTQRCVAPRGTSSKSDGEVFRSILDQKSG
jgi:hypothetical protein